MTENGKLFKIAIIDDEPDFIEVLTELLEPRDFQVCSAYDGKSGLELIRTEKPDVVLLDIMMPGMDGRDVMVKLRKNDETKDIPVIFFTAKTEQFSRNHGLELGAHEYVTKPFEATQLLRQITTVLDKKAKNRL